MPRARKPENKGLPARWSKRHGAFYYDVPKGLEKHWDGKKLFRLGSTLPDAYREWSKRIDATTSVRNIADLLDRYSREVIPEKALSTQETNHKEMKYIRAVFGAMALHTIRPQDIYTYVDKRGRKVAAHREIKLLSHAFTKAVQWGYIDRHPFKGQVRLEGEKPRERYVEDWEILECLKLKPKRKGDVIAMTQAYIRLKLLTGLPQRDLLLLQPAQFNDEGIEVIRHKTKRKSSKKTLYLWTPALREAVELAMQARPVEISPYLFCNRRGRSYVGEMGTASGWKSLWQRFMKRVMEETDVKERFTEHDLRAKAGSDAESLEHAQKLLAHASAGVTKRHYRRKAERVNPLR